MFQYHPAGVKPGPKLCFLPLPYQRHGRLHRFPSWAHTHCDVSGRCWWWWWWAAGLGPGRVQACSSPLLLQDTQQSGPDDPLDPGTHTHTQSSNINSTGPSITGSGSGSRENDSWVVFGGASNPRRAVFPDFIVQICPADVIWMGFAHFNICTVCISHLSPLLLRPPPPPAHGLIEYQDHQVLVAQPCGPECVCLTVHRISRLFM